MLITPAHVRQLMVLCVCVPHYVHALYMELVAEREASNSPALSDHVCIIYVQWCARMYV